MIDQRCLHHSSREAAARCPECRRYFCRECATEHEDRMICADCLRKLLQHESRRDGILQAAVRAGLPVLGLLVAWLLFYAAGRILLRTPAELHDGTLWSSQ